MLRSIFCTLLLVVCGASAQAQMVPQRVHLYSEARYPGETGAHAYHRFVERLSRYQQSGQGLPVPNTVTALNAARPLDQVDFSKLPAWPDSAFTVKAFKAVRDIQFLPDPGHGDKKRRSSWLYPDDGCFARAALMGQNLEGWKIARPMKLFIFGNLTVKTKNSPSGAVSWWYHVVPVVSMAGQPVVLDPAINPDHPLAVKDWIMTMTSSAASVKLSVCLPTTYGPSGPCDGIDADDKRGLTDQIAYLPYEWSRLVALHRDPVRELGEFPPWEKLLFNLETGGF